jgi:ABC-2 type transport system ATP-binding protein
VRRGDICGLLGPNGAGKSTTLRILLGLVRPDRGEARLLGERVTPGASVLHRVGAVVEEAALYPFLTGRQNLRLYERAASSRDKGGTRGGLGRTAERTRGGLGRTAERTRGGLGRTAERTGRGVDEALGISGLGRASDRKVKTYSHGMRQRLAIAQALLGAPEVLILDEPTTGLDPSGMKETRELLQVLAAEGAGILLSSHLLAEVELTCTTVVVMRDGAVIRRSSVADMLAGRDTVVEVGDPQSAAAALLAAGMAVDAVSGGRLTVRHDGHPRSEVVRILVAAGVPVESVGARTRLEDAFFSAQRSGRARPASVTEEESGP